MFDRKCPVDLMRLCLLFVSLGWLVITGAQPVAAQGGGPVQVLGCPNPAPGANPYNPCQWDARKIMAEIQNPHSDLVTVAAHRGTHSLAGTDQAPGVPENSLEAIGLAAQEGWESIEIDVKLTSDGVPVLSHDKVWGRESCVQDAVHNSGVFNPFAPVAPGSPTNPIVDSTSYGFLQSPANGVFLRDTVSIITEGAGNSCINPVSNQTPYVPTLMDAYNYIKAHNIQMVITLDIQTPARAAAAWRLLQTNNVTDAYGNPFYATTMWKIPAALFPNVAAYQATFHGLRGEINSQLINFNPVFHTSGIAPAGKCMVASDIDDIDDVSEDLGDAGDPTDGVEPGCPNSFGSEANMITWLNAFSTSPAVNLSALEISMKDAPPAGVLSTVQGWALGNNSSQKKFSLSSFNPVGEYISPTDPRPQFFSSANGSCCEVLDQFLFNNPNHIQDTNPSQAPYPNIPQYDHNDNRTDQYFTVFQLKANVVTTDGPGPLTAYLQSLGLRNVTYMQGAIDPNCNTDINQYPGCDSAGATTFTLCAAEGGTCTFTGDRNVVFGAMGKYTNPVTKTNTVACDVATLTDPLTGVVKACYISPPIGYYTGAAQYQVGSVYCADEGETCSYEGNATAVIAGGGKYSITISSPSNNFLCDVNTTFSSQGDPAKGVRKACFYQAIQGYAFAHYGPAGYQFCAGDNGSDTAFCDFKGPGRIAYGSTTSGGVKQFNYGVFNGGVACNSSVFGNPSGNLTKDCYYQVVTAATSVSSTGTGTGGGTGPCDLYATGGTPCVAAHSMVRALSSGYSGRLYQVTRASDGTSSDIGTLSAGGYANGAAQGSFCAGTACTVTQIYDQTSNHNDLTVSKGDSQAVATALPVTINGNEVYGLKVTPGVGYRNNATRGVATGASPEGMYMVTSGTYTNGGCCFDYGNAEPSATDTGAGHMDALNFGNYCEVGPCNGSGPWVEADLENGQYMGNGVNANPNNLSMGYNFVTAMLKNNGQTTFALKGGNAQSGGLTTDYSGTLPTVTVGGLTYIPMSKEGAIILGTGGDNSDRDIGSFFEGAMTSGYPTDAAENAVQANIVAAGYAGDSSGGSAGSGGSGVTEPAGSYTGPSDPGGPGPQDGFAPAAAEQQNDVMATKPALAAFNGSLFVAFQGVNVNNDIYVTSSTTGTNFPMATQYTNLQSSSAPSLATFNSKLFMAFRGLNVNNDFYVTSSTTGSNFPTATQYTNIQMGGAPALATFNNQLYAAFQANDAGHTLHITSSSDGVTWPAAWQIPNVAIGSDPAMAQFNGVLYVAFRANDPSNDVWIATSTDGHTFSSQALIGQTMDGYSSPALVVSNGVLYYIYEANDQGHEMLVTASTDGVNWQGPAAYLGLQMGELGPGAAAFGTGVTVGFQSNDSRNVLFITNKVTEATSYTGLNDPGGPGPQDGFASPAALQSNEVMATKPALASFNGSLYVAFQGVNVNNDLYVTSSPTGTNFPMATQYTNLQSSSAPALATFNNELFMAFRGLGVNNDFYVTSSPTGSNFPMATQYTNIQMGGAPALAVFNNQLCAAFQAVDTGHTLHIACSSDGVTWPAAWQVSNIAIGSDPAMAVFNGVLYVAFRANDPSNDVWIASSADGINFSSQVLAGQTMGGSSSPALVVSNNVLYYIYGANDIHNEMLVTASADGFTWDGPAAYLGLQMGPLGPGAAAFANGVYVGFQSNDSRNVLFVTNKVTEASTYAGPTDGGTGGLQDGFTPTAAIQPNDIMGSKPALAAFRANLFAAFKGSGGNNSLYVTASPTGSNFPTATQYANILMSGAPAITQFNNQLYVAFRGVGVNNDLYTTSSPTGSNFPTAIQHTNIQMGSAPAMALFNNQLYIAFQANDAGHSLHVTSSSDGVNWPAAWEVPNVALGSDPAMAVFNGMLYIAFRANDPSNDVWIASSSDGVNFNSFKLAGQTMASGSSPALAVVLQNDGNYLYYAYEADDTSHEMLVSTTTDGSTWKSPALYSNVNMGATGPAATGFGNTAYVGFQSNDARNVLFVTSQPVSGQSAVGGTYLPNSTFYPRLVRLSHGPAATNGNIVASTDGNIFVSNQGSSAFVFTGTVPSQYGYHLGSGTLYELPQTVGSLQAGTLLYAATYYYGSGHNTAIEVNTSTDGGKTWQYSSMPVSGAGFLGDGFWEPQFTVANDGALVMFWSDETDSCCSQKLSQIRTYNGTTWQDRTNTVASGIQADRPGMAVVTKLPSGVYFMSYELCGPASCTAVYRTSTDGWNFGTPGNTGTKIQTASGQYFQHSPTNVWSPSPLGINGALLLIGQQMFDSTGVTDPNSGSQMFVNLSSDGSGPWYTIAAPISVPNPPNDYCPNYSTALLPAVDGSNIFELASGYNNNNQCVSFTRFQQWNQLPTDGSYYALENQFSSLCLGGGAKSQTPAVQTTCTDSNGVYDQYWQVHSQGRGWFTIQSEATGLCLDNVGGSTTPGNLVDVWTCTANDPNQNWQFMDLGNGQFKLLNQAGQLPLDDAGGSHTAGTQLDVWTDNSLTTQRWVLH